MERGKEGNEVSIYHGPFLFFIVSTAGDGNVDVSQKRKADGMG